MDGAVRGLGRVLLQDEPHLLVGAESGELCLFRARDGKRAWKQRLDDPIRQVDALPPPVSLALAVTRGEMLTIFEQVTDPEDAYTKALEQIQSLDNPPTATPAAECALAFYQLLREGRDFLEVLQAHQGRETRTRLLRYLVQKAEVLTLDRRPLSRNWIRVN
jgi:hypothetical protein